MAFRWDVLPGSTWTIMTHLARLNKSLGHSEAATVLASHLSGKVVVLLTE